MVRSQRHRLSSDLAWATKVNREEQQVSQQWAEVMIKKEGNNQGEVRLNCGKWTICVEPGFSPALLSDILRVVDALC